MKATFVLCLIFSLSIAICATDEIVVQGGFMHNAWAQSDSSQLLALEILSTKNTSTYKNPCQIIFCVDASRYMEGSPINLVKHSVKSSLSYLTKDDYVGVITYNDQPRVEFPIKKLVGTVTKDIARSIDLIRFKKARNLSLTLDLIEEQLMLCNTRKNTRKSVILVTNGNPQEGVLDRDSLMQRIVAISKQYQASFSTIGYDKYFDEDFLIACAKNTGGTALVLDEYHVEYIASVIPSIVSWFKASFYKNIAINIDLPKGVTIGKVYGAVQAGQSILVKDMGSNEMKPVIVELFNPPARSKDLAVEVQYTKLNNMQKRSLPVYIDLRVNEESCGYNKKYASNLITFSILQDVTKSLTEFKKGKLVRNECANELKERLKTLEQTRMSLDSPFFNRSIKFLNRIQFYIKNEAIEDEYLLKLIDYIKVQYLSAVRLYH